MTPMVIVALAERGSKKHPELAMRIGRAVRLIERGGIRRDADGNFVVPSQSQDGSSYLVNGVCECPDYTGTDPKTGEPLTEFAPDGWCKHRLAMALLLRAEREQAWREAELALAHDRVARARASVTMALQELEQATAALVSLVVKHEEVVT